MPFEKLLLGANPNHIISRTEGENNMCEYCDNISGKENKMIDEVFQIYGTELCAFCINGHETVAEIAYCPMCGRELEDDF